MVAFLFPYLFYFIVFPSCILFIFFMGLQSDCKKTEVFPIKLRDLTPLYHSILNFFYLILRILIYLAIYSVSVYVQFCFWAGVPRLEEVVRCLHISLFAYSFESVSLSESKTHIIFYMVESRKSSDLPYSALELLNAQLVNRHLLSRIFFIHF